MNRFVDYVPLSFIRKFDFFLLGRIVGSIRTRARIKSGLLPASSKLAVAPRECPMAMTGPFSDLMTVQKDLGNSPLISD
jgi:hypothetical protein